MWPILAALISSIIGLGAGLVGFGNPQTSYPAGLVTPTPYFRACFHPQPAIKLTLSWPDDFINVPDNRPQLNPGKFSGLPPVFSSNGDANSDGVADCKNMVLNSNTSDIQMPQAQRTYIQVRSDVRISSCKTDELAGQFGTGFCPETENAQINAVRHRGSCTLSDYTDLRKVAETVVNGEPKEIFWNPFSYNTGCNYTQDKNCGPPENRSNPNLKDFVYVLKKRDAFDPASRPGCPVLWDAGSTNADACSHYFDVYIAQDFYEQAKLAPPTSDPNNPYYFVKNIVENCQEQSHFTPVPDSILWIPPSFIRQPFLPVTQGLSPLPDKINPQNQIERTNYNYFIWSKSEIIKTGITNLVKITQSQESLNICIPNLPKNNCYDPVGTISFTGEDAKAENFKVYSRISAPQTFILVKTTDTTITHIYMITDKDMPTQTRHDPTLQLRSMEFISQNQWTWATPWCKPAVYLYPEKETEINVKLSLHGKLTYSDPPYNNLIGWKIIAKPDGQLSVKDTSDGGEATTSTPPRWSNKTYPYLYYEADIKGIDIPDKGWVFPRNELKLNLNKILLKIGFNDKEVKDFMDYWLPKLKEKPWYFVTLIPEDLINVKEKLILSQNPDTLIRTRVVFEGLDSPLTVSPLTLPDNKIRSGFTVTDWGGTIIGRSCTDLKF